MKILVAYDGSESSKKAFDRAVEMAMSFGADLTLLAVTEHVCPLGITELDYAKMDEILQKQTQEILSGLQKELERRALNAATAVRRGNAAEEIVKFAEEENIDTIVIGSHGRHGARRFFLGSVSSRVANQSHCTVVIVK
jgi:nucleotide-binding universal stress UspA family protein